MAESKPNKQEELIPANFTIMMEPEQGNSKVATEEVGVTEEIGVTATNIIAEEIAEKVNVSVSDKTVAKTDNTAKVNVVKKKPTQKRVKKQQQEFSEYCNKVLVKVIDLRAWANLVLEPMQKRLLEEAAAIRAFVKELNELEPNDLALDELVLDELALDRLMAAAVGREEKAKLMEASREAILDEVAATCKLVEGARHQLDEALPRDKGWMSCKEQLKKIKACYEVVNGQAEDVETFLGALNRIWKNSLLDVSLKSSNLEVFIESISSEAESISSEDDNVSSEDDNVSSEDENTPPKRPYVKQLRNKLPRNL